MCITHVAEANEMLVTLCVLLGGTWSVQGVRSGLKESEKVTRGRGGE